MFRVLGFRVQSLGFGAQDLRSLSQPVLWEVSSKFSGGVSEVDACYNEGLGCRDFGVILGLYWGYIKDYPPKPQTVAYLCCSRTCGAKGNAAGRFVATPEFRSTIGIRVYRALGKPLDCRKKPSLKIECQCRV